MREVFNKKREGYVHSVPPTTRVTNSQKHVRKCSGNMKISKGTNNSPFGNKGQVLMKLIARISTTDPLEGCLVSSHRISAIPSLQRRVGFRCSKDLAS